MENRNETTTTKWEYKNLQFRTVPTWGLWSRISENDLALLELMQKNGWEVYQTENIRGGYGFTAHVLFLLRRQK
jgi:hypothetical protein